MTDLRKAAEDILETLDKPFTSSKTIFQAQEALRQALAQLEQKYDYRIKYDIPCYKCGSNFCPGNCKEPAYLEQLEQESVECMCGICKLGKREWVGITKEDKKEILEMTQPDERGYVIAITEAKLKEKNA